jgi:hypothetical protein
LHRALFFYPIPFAGTELAEMAGDPLKNKKDGLNPRTTNYFFSRINISAMSDQELRNIFRVVYLRFYLKPQRVFRLIRVFINHPELFKIELLTRRLIYTFLPGRRLKSLTGL